MGWRPAHVAVALSLMACALFAAWDAWTDIYLIAGKDEEASHIFLVPLVVAWLVFARKERLRSMIPGGHWWGLATIALGAILFRIGDRYLIQSFWHGGAVIMVLGGIITACGRDVLRFFLPAFIACVFMVPIPGRVRQAVAVPLQNQTAKATAAALELGGADVQLSGNLITVKGKPITVEEACNGMRMVFALALVSYTFAFATPLRWYVRVLILLATPVSAVVCNVIRLVPTVYAYTLYSDSVAEKIHDVGGWVMLVVSFLLLMGIIRSLRWVGVPVTPFRLAAE